MRAVSRLVSIAAAALLFTACADRIIGPPAIVHLQRDLTPGEQQLVAADNAFAFALFRQISSETGADSNVFISPLSVGMALGMTVNGAAGATRDSMLAALQLAGIPMSEVNQAYHGVIHLLKNLDPGVAFTLANSIWYRNGIPVGQAFLDTTSRWFDAQVQSLDFGSPSAAETINGWVNEQTQGKITEIVDNPIPDSVIMYLINAIYFKGNWTTQFDPARTRNGMFTLRSGATVTASMMTHGKEVPVLTYWGDGVRVLDLPYAGRAYSMTIVLPQSPAGFDSLAANLTRERWDGWIAGLDSGEATISMPKFKLTFDKELTPTLSALGMGIAFCGGESDFSGILPGAQIGDVCITKVKHKTYVDVNEEGTEAAAVTSVEIGLTSAPMPFVVDRPFIVAIRERLTGTILFLGRVMNPVAS